MCRYKKIIGLICVSLISLNIIACGQEEESEIVPIVPMEEFSIIQQESDIQAAESINSQTTANEDAAANEVKTDLFEGEYSDYDVNEPSLEIKKNNDETYQIQIELFRLWFFEDGVGTITEDGLEFAATGPGGNEVHGIIQLEEDIATVTILGQEWLDFAGLSEYKFYKTSDVPNMHIE